MKKWNLDEPLLRFGDEPDANAFTIRKSFESLLVFGAVGSGKTSAVGNKTITEMMRKDYGMLILTAKPDDADTYKKYAAMVGRTKDVIEVKHGGKHAFNFMQYESTVKSELSFARNLQDLLNTIIAANQEKNGGAQDDPFWSQSLESLIKSTIQLLLLAYGEVTIPALFDIVQSSPSKERKEDHHDEPSAFKKAMSAAKEKVKVQVDEWKECVGEEYWRSLADDVYVKKLEDYVPDFRTLRYIRTFFTETMYEISEKTRGIITLCFSSFLSNLLDDPIYTLFCNKPSTFTPESCIDEGKIIIVNLPVALYSRVGQDVQVMMKYIFQKAWQRRNLALNERPLSIIADEAQLFLHPQDPTLLATARSSRIATVYLSQNLPVFHANIGGDASKAEAKVDALLSLLSTKIFLCNSCVKTNEWASKIIGKAYIEDFSTNMNFGGNFSFGEGTSYRLEEMVRPEHFAQLRTGGPLNNNIVQGFIHMQGTRFHDGFNHKKIAFKQTF